MDKTTLIERMQQGNGVARTERLYEWGASRHDISKAVQAGALIRVRRGWVALPEADPALRAAARHGVVISCLSQAKRLGLWVHAKPAHPHVAASPGSAGNKPENWKVHWGIPLVARHPDALEDPIENVLSLVAECEPFEQALATWESALRQGFVDMTALRQLPLRPAAARILAEAQPFADVGLETYLRVRLRWLRLPMRFQPWIGGHRVDALIGDRLVLQVDGGTHVGAQRDEDNRHDAQLKLMGYHVIRIGYAQIMHQWHVVQDLVMRAVAQGLHGAPAT